MSQLHRIGRVATLCDRGRDAFHESVCVECGERKLLSQVVRWVQGEEMARDVVCFVSEIVSTSLVCLLLAAPLRLARRPSRSVRPKTSTDLCRLALVYKPKTSTGGVRLWVKRVISMGTILNTKNVSLIVRSSKDGIVALALTIVARRNR